MAIKIDVQKVGKVLLADGWHHVVAGTFELYAYEVAREKENALPEGRIDGIWPTGFAFVDAGTHERISGPVNAIGAVAEKV